MADAVLTRFLMPLLSLTTNQTYNVSLYNTTSPPTTSDFNVTRSTNPSSPALYAKQLLQFLLLGCFFLVVPLVTSSVVVLKNYLFCCCLVKKQRTPCFKRTFSKHIFLCKFFFSKRFKFCFKEK